MEANLYRDRFRFYQRDFHFRLFDQARCFSYRVRRALLILSLIIYHLRFLQVARIDERALFSHPFGTSVLSFASIAACKTAHLEREPE